MSWFNQKFGESSWVSIAKLLLTLSLFSFLIFHYFHNLKIHNFHWDEYNFIRKSYYFDLFFVKKDFTDIRWYEGESSAQSKVGPYIYGLSIHFSGIKDIEQTFERIHFNDFQIKGGKWWEKLWSRKIDNYTQDFIPIVNLIWQGRKTSIFFTMGALFFLFIIGLKIKGFLFGLIAAFLLGLNSLLFEYGSRAMTDSMLLFFFFVNLFLVLHLLDAFRKKSYKKAAFIALVIGVNCALGVGVKITGILIYLILITIFFVLITLYRKNRYVLFNIISSFLVLTLSFFIVLTILHPFLYNDTFNRFKFMFTGRLGGAIQDQLRYPGSAVYSRRDAMKVIANRTIFPKGNYINFKLNNLPIDLTLFLLGLVFLGSDAIKKLKTQRIVSGELVLLLWMLVVVGSLIFYLKNSWPRFFLPTVSVITITQAYAITIILVDFAGRYKKIKSIVSRKL